MAVVEQSLIRAVSSPCQPQMSHRGCGRDISVEVHVHPAASLAVLRLARHGVYAGRHTETAAYSHEKHIPGDLVALETAQHKYRRGPEPLRIASFDIFDVLLYPLQHRVRIAQPAQFRIRENLFAERQQSLAVYPLSQHVRVAGAAVAEDVLKHLQTHVAQVLLAEAGEYPVQSAQGPAAAVTLPEGLNGRIPVVVGVAYQVLLRQSQAVCGNGLFACVRGDRVLDRRHYVHIRGEAVAVAVLQHDFGPSVRRAFPEAELPVL